MNTCPLTAFNMSDMLFLSSRRALITSDKLFDFARDFLRLPGSLLP